MRLVLDWLCWDGDEDKYAQQNSQYGKTALHYAAVAETSKFPVVELLVAAAHGRGANLEAADKVLSCGMVL